MVEDFNKKIFINLLPRDVIDKRQAEKYLVLGFFAMAALVALMLLVYGVNYVRIAGRQGEVDNLVAENSRYAAAIGQNNKFEDRKALVDQRRQLLDKVSVNEFTWSRFLNNVSLVVPSDVWIRSISGDQEKIAFEGSAPSTEETTTQMGHTAVAKWLVHLGEISSLKEVWLDSSDKIADKDSPVPQVDFKSSALIKGYLPEELASAVKKPAPPAAPGGNP